MKPSITTADVARAFCKFQEQRGEYPDVRGSTIFLRRLIREQFAAYHPDYANAILYLEVLWFIKKYAPLIPPSSPIDVSVLRRVYDEFRMWLHQYDNFNDAMRSVQLL